MAFHVPNKLRVAHPLYVKLEVPGNNGFFVLPHPNQNSNAQLKVLASDGEGWEHVSVSLFNRCPTWAEMCYVKDMFWDPEDCVVQFHPPQSEYVNNHPYVLHMWRKIGSEFETPPSMLVGIK